MNYLRFVVLTASMCSALACAETIIVEAVNPDLTWSTTVLEAGKTYEITVEGKVYWDTFGHFENGVYEPGNWSDAEWFGGNWAFSNHQLVEQQGDKPGDGFDLVINDTFLDWQGEVTPGVWAPHVYSPTHIYKHWFVGTGSAISFRYADLYPTGTDWYNSQNWHSDDSGEFKVTIQSMGEPSVPGPSAVIPMLAGLAVSALRKKKR